MSMSCCRKCGEYLGETRFGSRIQAGSRVAEAEAGAEAVSADLDFTCRVCRSRSAASVVVGREQMFGELEEFDYVECANCGAVQIGRIPGDLARHYGGGYYSLDVSRESLVKLALKLLRARDARGQRTPGGGLVRRLAPLPPLPSWFTQLGMGFDDRILDVGCGSGQFLLALRNSGYRNLEGVDPYLASDVRYGGGVRISKCGIEGATGKYKLVAMLDSFEHMPDQLSALRAARGLLDEPGFVVIRMPVVAWAWREYREHWVQLDAPRHLTLHTRKSFGILSAEADLSITHVVDDSSAFQIWGSEQYLRGISLNAPESLAVNSDSAVFTPSELADFDRRAHELKSSGDGDTACFVLVRSPG